MNEVITVQNTGNSIQPASFSFSLMERFIAFTDVKPTTLQGYKVCLRQFAAWISENGITRPTREDIYSYKSYLDAQPLKAATKQQYLRAVKHFFKWTAAEGLYSDISANIKGWKVRQDNTRKESFLEDDIKAVLDNIDRSTPTGKRDFAMILLSVTGGLRIIEMQRADIGDLQTIKRQRVLYIQGKGHDSKDDYIKLIPQVAEALEEYLQAIPAAKKTDPLFIGLSNRAKFERLTEPSISRIIKTRFKEAGFDCDKLTAHSLRHTSNTLLFKSGADLYTVQHHARHADPKTTEIYIHALDKEKDDSEQRIYNQIFLQGEKTFKEKALELLQQIPDEAQEAALDYLTQLTQQTQQKQAI